MNHLLRIHIGPVQEFIAAARRSRDLWFGSWLLSELSKAAARGIVEAQAAALDALIFPAPVGADELARGSPFVVANEIVAVVDGQPEDVAAAARAAVAERLAELVNETFTSLRPYLTANGTWAVAEAQLEEFVEFYWAAVPFDGSDYPAARALADRLLAARKGTRTFAPVAQPRPWPKSSLDGARESVIPDGETRNVETMYARYKARRGEHLSGIDLLKRLGRAGDESRFPSTSHMAAMPLKGPLAQSATAAAAWPAYLSALPGRVRDMERAYHTLHLPVLADETGPLDGSLLFASRLLDHLEGEALRKAERALRAFFKAAEIDEPNPYYVLLAGDGDRMGDAISALATPADNRAFSQALAGFAGAAGDIVHDHDGAVVYAGGDDVLALLPVHTAVDCAAALAAAFGAALAGYGAAGRPPTFSVGLAIVHHLEPLEDALALARRAERAAKEVDGDDAVDGKNALAVALDKRSGAPRLVAGHWGALDRRLLALAALHQAEAIPDRLAYQLLDSYHLLGGAQTLAADPALGEILALEAGRLVKRKRDAGGQTLLAGGTEQIVRQAVADAGVIAAAADELVIAALLAKVNALAGRAYPLATPEGTPS